MTAQDLSPQEQQDRVKKLQETFIAVTSHKFLSPITVIKWNLEILEADESLDDKTKDKLKDIHTNVQKLDDLTKILLRIYEVGTSSGSAKFQQVNISDLFDDVLKEFSLLIQQNSIQVKNNIPKDTKYEIPGGVSFVREIIRSVVENAIHYNRVGGMIQIDIKNISDKIEIIVSDTGIGIPEKERELIFNPFYRGSNVLKLSFKGNGLRLYMVKLGLGLINGKVEFESEVEKGSKFHIFFPIKQS